MFVFLFGLVLNLFVSQSTFTVIGSVRDQGGRTVNGVRLSVIDENFQPIRTFFIDNSGRFTVSGLGQGKFTFRVETTGTPYEEQTQQLELQSIRRLGGNETFPLDFVLKFKKGSAPASAAGSVFAQDVPKPARKEFERGVNDLKGGKSDLAVASFKKAIEIFPDYNDALELLATEFVKNGQYEAAIPLFTHALEINKRSYKSLYGLGVAYLKLNRLPEAIEWLQKSVQLEPNSANAQMMLGLAYGNSGAFDKSEEGFKKALQLGGAAAAEAHFYLAGLYNKLEKYGEARQELELFLKEAKNIKDSAQIKAMIEKLGEKEKTKPSQAQALSETAAPSQAVQSGAVTGPASVPAPTVSEQPSSANDKPLPPAPLPTLPAETAELLRNSESTGAAMHRQLFDFTYTLKKTMRILNDRGNSIHSQEQVFEAYPIRGEHVLIKLSTDGIQSRDVASERKRAMKELEEAERRRKTGQQNEDNAGKAREDYLSAGVSGIYGGKPGYISINVSSFLRACEFFSPRVETVDGRRMAVLSFRPRFGIDLPRNHAYINKLVGLIWIDQNDKVVTRLEGWPAAEGAFDLVQSTAPRDEAALIYQQKRQPDGLWFPHLVRMNAEGRPELFDGLNWDVVFEFSNYQRFNTSADDLKIKTPAKNP